MGRHSGESTCLAIARSAANNSTSANTHDTPERVCQLSPRDHRGGARRRTQETEGGQNYGGLFRVRLAGSLARWLPNAGRPCVLLDRHRQGNTCQPACTQPKQAGPGCSPARGSHTTTRQGAPSSTGKMNITQRKRCLERTEGSVRRVERPDAEVCSRPRAFVAACRGAVSAACMESWLSDRHNVTHCSTANAEHRHRPTAEYV